MFFWHNFNPSPIAFFIFDWPVHWYGLVLALAFLVAYFYANKRARELNIPNWSNIFWTVFLGGAVAARIWDFFFYQNFWRTSWYEIFFVWQGGLAIHGFLLGALLGLVILKLLNSKFQILNSLVLLAPVFLVAQAIGRWGNFFNQELYGTPSTLPWGIYIAPANRLPGFEFFQYFHPVFLYESLWLFFGFGIFLWLEKKLSSQAQTRDPSTPVGMTRQLTIHNSQFTTQGKILLGFFMGWIFSGRALMELFRLDPTPLWFGLRAPLVYSALIALISLVYMLFVIARDPSADGDRGDP